MLIAKSSLMRERPKRGRPATHKELKKIKRKALVPNPQDDIRTQHSVDHFPVFGKKDRCALCTTEQTLVTCSVTNNCVLLKAEIVF